MITAIHRAILVRPDRVPRPLLASARKLEQAVADWQKAYADWQKAVADERKADTNRRKADTDWQKAEAEFREILEKYAGQLPEILG